jgi:hypothetical protein
VRALAVIVLAPAFALGAVAGAVGIVGGPTKQIQRPDSLVWAERVFANRDSFETWLRARGASYTTWAQRHPSAPFVFDTHERRVLSAEPPSTQRTKGHSLLVALVAGASLVLLFAIYALRSRHGRLPTRRPLRRPAKPVVLPRARLRPLKAAFAGPLLATSAAAAVRRQSTLVTAVHDSLAARRLRHLAPVITFYAIAVVLAVVIGASVAIYLQ